MDIAFICPECHQGCRQEVAPGVEQIGCAACGHSIDAPTDAFKQDHLRRCLVCPSVDLFIRKDFPQQLGVAIVVVGIVASSLAWAYYHPLVTYAILFATALIDVVLYLVVPDALMCYRCGAQYRGVPGIETHGAFNLETHERHRQQVARMAGQRQR